MSYALTAPLRGLGQAPTIPTLETIEGHLPTRDEIRRLYEPYQSTIDRVPLPRGFDPVKFATTGEGLDATQAIAWTLRTAEELRKHLGLQLPDMSVLTKIAKGELEWLDEFGVPLTTIPTNVREVAMALAITAAFNVCKQLGIPPEIGTMTVESLADGELTSRDVQSMGGLSGGIAGSYLGGLIGIPPQLGGFVGGYLGKMLGGGVSDLLGIGGGRAEREERRRAEREARQQVRGMLEQVRGQYQQLVPPSRTIFWMVFDDALKQIENEWEQAECLAGTIFPILWGASSGPRLDLRPDEDPFLRYAFYASRCPPPNQALWRNPKQCVSFSQPIEPGTRQGCPSVFRCPYPSFPNLGAGDVERVAQAFAAYNFWWIQPPSRGPNTDAWVRNVPRADDRTVAYIARLIEVKSRCASDRCRLIQDGGISQSIDRYKTGALDPYLEQAGPGRLLESAIRVQADVATSAAAYRALYQLRGNGRMFRDNVGEALRRAVDRNRRDAEIVMAQQGKLLRDERLGKTIGALLNYGVPAAGALMLAGALWRRR